MRAYKVIAVDGAAQLGFRFAGTAAESKIKRDELVAQFSIKKKDVSIEDCEVPTGKAELLEFLNTMAAEQDAVEDEEE